ncbi:MAG: type I-E CRISPR-associated protein Cas5/CasD [Deltaproteobacteria bacterium]|nr:type I-E CRISPR-associated protein Cas5/CasD [Deltaproteobacteria bacterium]
MQAWGDHESKFFVRRTAGAPTKSGVIGLLCAAMGLDRASVSRDWLSRLADLEMGVRVDRPGVRWWDYHTVGAGMYLRVAESEGKTRPKPETMLTRREYLCDASFLVALRGESKLIGRLDDALLHPVWTIYLGRKSCPPGRPVRASDPGTFDDLESALCSVPWQRRCRGDEVPHRVDALLDWRPTPDEPLAPDDAQVWYDVPLTFDPPAHQPRFVVGRSWTIGKDGEVALHGDPAQHDAKAPPRPRANYKNTEYRKARLARLEADKGLCVFCKSPATTVQHITYRRAGGNESHDDLRALCRLCHDAVTMIEYGEGMGIDRINPEDAAWRDRIIRTRDDIIRFRSLETRRRRLSAEEVE